MRKIRGHCGQGLSAARCCGRLGQQFEVHQALAAVPQRRADAVGARVAAADHDHVLALGARCTCRRSSCESSRLLVLRVRNSMAKWMPFSSRPGMRQIARLGGAGGQQHGVVSSAARSDRRTDLLAALLHDLRHVAGGKSSCGRRACGDELDAFLAQQLDAPLDDALVELHVRDAVHQQAADAVGPLVDGDLVADLVELGGGGQAGGAASRRSPPSCRCALAAAAARPSLRRSRGR